MLESMTEEELASAHSTASTALLTSFFDTRVDGKGAEKLLREVRAEMDRREAQKMGFAVFGEVGKKFAEGDTTRKSEEEVDEAETIREMKALLDAGCERVYWEGHLLRRVMGEEAGELIAKRETGTAQVKRVAAAVGQDRIIFEVSPLRISLQRRALQFWLINLFGTEVNIGNARLEELGLIEAEAYTQNDCFAAGVQFADGPIVDAAHQPHFRSQRDRAFPDIGCGRLDVEVAIQLIDRQGQAGAHLQVDGGQVRLAQLLPQAGGHVATVTHGDAGAADHGVEVVAHHEFGQRAPQRHDRRAVAVVGVHAGATQLDHLVAHRAQAGQVELGFAVQATDALGRFGRQHTVGADDLAGLARGLVGGQAHQQVLAVRIEQVDVVAFRAADGHVQARPHLLGEDRVPQALGCANILFSASPNDLQALTRGSSGIRLRRAWVKRPPGGTVGRKRGREVCQRQGGQGQVTHGHLRGIGFGHEPAVWWAGVTSP